MNTDANVKEIKNPFLELAPYEVCEGVDHLERRYQDIVDGGGEGVILRDPNCPFQEGRSAGYLKHKVPLTSLWPTSLVFYTIVFFLRNSEMLKPRL